MRVVLHNLSCASLEHSAASHGLAAQRKRRVRGRTDKCLLFQFCGNDEFTLHLFSSLFCAVLRNVELLNIEGTSAWSIYLQLIDCRYNFVFLA